MVLSSAAGVLLAILWSFHFVDSVIGETVADSLLGRSAKEATLSGCGVALLFALVSGVAGTLTACNIAMAASLGPLGQAGRSGPSRKRATGRPRLRGGHRRHAGPGAALARRPGPVRAAAITGALLIALGVFTVVYWDLRLPAIFGYGWFPTMPYN